MEERPVPSAVTRRGKPSERGQVLVLFVLIMLTCTAIATVAVSVGQVAVRRQQAQMIVDAAAFAGAAKQAEGLNNIAQLNKMSFDLLQGIYIVTFIPYVDSDSTFFIRSVLGAASYFTNDWAGPVLKDYQKFFDTINGAINVTNRIYSNAGLPRIAAEEVVNANFGNGSDKLFKSADKGSSGYANPIDLFKNGGRLVTLTNPDSYNGHSYTYAPSPNHPLVTACANTPFPANLIPCGLVANGLSVNGTVFIFRNFIDPIKYETGRFYNQSQGDDVRFTYRLTVTQAPVLFGRSWFDDIPEITVVATAKPYNGYLGKKFNGGGFVPFSQDKEIRITYQAKLVPVRNADKIFAARFDFSKAARILH